MAERRDENAVLEGYTPDCEGREELWDGGSIGLRVDCSSCWRVLSWREEWDTFSWLQVRRGLTGALARRHDRLGDGHHNLLRARHCDFLLVGLNSKFKTQNRRPQRRVAEAVYMMIRSKSGTIYNVIVAVVETVYLSALKFSYSGPRLNTDGNSAEGHTIKGQVHVFLPASVLESVASLAQRQSSMDSVRSLFPDIFFFFW